MLQRKGNLINKKVGTLLATHTELQVKFQVQAVFECISRKAQGCKDLLPILCVEERQ
jgi:hypothetical protein